VPQGLLLWTEPADSWINRRRQSRPRPQVTCGLSRFCGPYLDPRRFSLGVDWSECRRVDRAYGRGQRAARMMSA